MTRLALKLLRHRAGPAAAALIALTAGALVLTAAGALLLTAAGALLLTAAGVHVLTAAGALVESGLRPRPAPTLYPAADVVVAHRAVIWTGKYLTGDTETATAALPRAAGRRPPADEPPRVARVGRPGRPVRPAHRRPSGRHERTARGKRTACPQPTAHPGPSPPPRDALPHPASGPRRRGRWGVSRGR